MAMRAASEMAGTTSACAENTGIIIASTGDNWNYLRVRGEYQDAFGRCP